MSPQAEYWRDRLMKIHAWAIAAEMLLVGWIAAPGDLVNFNKTDDGVPGPSFSMEIKLQPNGGHVAADFDTGLKAQDEASVGHRADPRHDANGFIAGFLVGNLLYQTVVWWIRLRLLRGERLDSTVLSRMTTFWFMNLRMLMVLGMLLYAASG